MDYLRRYETDKVQDIPLARSPCLAHMPNNEITEDLIRRRT